jgi:hypothetical protein
MRPESKDGRMQKGLIRVAANPSGRRMLAVPLKDEELWGLVKVRWGLWSLLCVLALAVRSPPGLRFLLCCRHGGRPPLFGTRVDVVWCCVAVWCGVAWCCVAALRGDARRRRRGVVWCCVAVGWVLNRCGCSRWAC